MHHQVFLFFFFFFFFLCVVVVDCFFSHFSLCENKEANIRKVVTKQLIIVAAGLIAIKSSVSLLSEFRLLSFF